MHGAIDAKSSFSVWVRLLSRTGIYFVPFSSVCLSKWSPLWLEKSFEKETLVWKYPRKNGNTCEKTRENKKVTSCIHIIPDFRVLCVWSRHSILSNKSGTFGQKLVEKADANSMVLEDLLRSLKTSFYHSLLPWKKCAKKKFIFCENTWEEMDY